MPNRMNDAQEGRGQDDGRRMCAICSDIDITFGKASHVQSTPARMPETTNRHQLAASSLCTDVSRISLLLMKYQSWPPTQSSGGRFLPCRFRGSAAVPRT